MADLPHTFGPDCSLCGDRRSGTRCDLAGYSVRRVRFVLAHREAFNSAYLNPDRRSASNELQRLEREYATMPPRHDCSCVCPNVRHGRMQCAECRRLAAQRPQGPDIGVSIGRGAMVNPPMPMPLLLDLERAIAVVGNDDPAAIARYMSLNGTSLAPATVPVQFSPPSRIEEPLPAVLEASSCDCLGYRLGGAGFCVHLAAS